ncbi:MULTISPECIES: DUF4168 domain-containing protein [Microbulbifer]|uniref:DUF4168 domain-containing protein n=1 Tax=Microbulbifer TaxID=48073 RepID=UPI001E3C82D4|nr:MULTISPECIES: DUF4168 domain-containing protein [Microbulbifer]UHQ56985.1 DUF4168 domain-containing protein [Microbulbifer sp. YPW16]
MKIPAICIAALSLVLALSAAHAQNGEAGAASARAASYSEPKLESFANAYRSIVILSREYAPKLKAAENIEQAEALNKEAQGKMVAAIQQAGLTKEEYQQIAASLKDDPKLVERINGMLQKHADSE